MRLPRLPVGVCRWSRRPLAIRPSGTGHARRGDGVPDDV